MNFNKKMNSKEVLILQSWIEKNMNSSCRNRQSEFIDLFDILIENHIIEDDESDILLKNAEDIIFDMLDKIKDMTN